MDEVSALGFEKTGCFDIVNLCSSFIYRNAQAHDVAVAALCPITYQSRCGRTKITQSHMTGLPFHNKVQLGQLRNVQYTLTRCYVRKKA